MTDRKRDANGLLFVPVDWRVYNWDTGLWDISDEYWASPEGARETMCLHGWVIGSDDWRSL